MEIINLIDEDFIQYKKPSMFIGLGTCDFKCDKECGKSICQNSALASAKKITVDINEIVKRFCNNPITKAIVLGGLEPFSVFDDICELIISLRNIINQNNKDFPDIVIYTGYYPEEIEDKINILKTYSDISIIIKFGRFIPDKPSKYDELLGIQLASDNQFALKIKDTE